MAKDERIEARLSAEAKQLIERAAGIIGVSVSDFIVSRAYEAAAGIVSNHDTWVLSRRDSRGFIDAVLNPREPNAALKAAAARYTT